MQSVLNFSLEVVRPPDGAWGSLRGGSWSGMVGMVHAGEADMSMSEFTLTEQRAGAVDFSVPIMEDTTHLTMLKPGGGKWMRRYYSRTLKTVLVSWLDI